MSKNLLSKYRDDRLDDEDLKTFEPLHSSRKDHDDEKERTLRLKRARQAKHKDD